VVAYPGSERNKLLHGGRFPEYQIKMKSEVNLLISVVNSSQTILLNPRFQEYQIKMKSEVNL
jgi:hypothetical protein